MSNRIDLDDPGYNQNQNRVVIQDNKAKMLWAVIGVLAMVLIVVAVTQSGNGSSKSSSSNQTVVSCPKNGNVKTYLSTHTSYCQPDADGYYNIAFGHHHHY